MSGLTSLDTQLIAPVDTPRRPPNWSSQAMLVAWVIIAFGAALRIYFCLTRGSLWLDEAKLALNIVNRTFAGLLKPLDYEQGSPIGFLMLEKAITQWLGNSERALRLLPLIGALLSLPLFLMVVKRCLNEQAGLAALVLFATIKHLIHYSGEVKQYSTDVAVCLAIFWCVLRIHQDGPGLFRILLLGLIGIAGPWLSHPAIFVLAGAGLASFASAAADRRRGVVITWAITGLACTASFLALFMVSLRELSAHKFLLEFWESSFVPWPVVSVKAARWFLSTYFYIFSNPGGLAFSGLAGALAILGGVGYFRRSRAMFALVVAPLAATLLAAMLHHYPFNGRLLLFAAPFLLLLVSAGVEFLWNSAPTRKVIGLVMILVLFACPLHDLTKMFSKSPEHTLQDLPGDEEVAPVIKYVAAHYQPGDTLAVYSEEPVLYYAQRYGLDVSHMRIFREPGRVWSDNDHEKKVRSLQPFKGQKRVWFILSHIQTRDGDHHETIYPVLLDSMGKRLDETKSPGAWAYLYDLTPP